MFIPRVSQIHICRLERPEEATEELLSIWSPPPHSCKLTKRLQVRGNARLLACWARSTALILRARREDCLRLVRRQQRGLLIVEMFWQKKKHMSAGVSSAQWWGARCCPAVSHHRHVTQVKTRHNVKFLGLSCETTTFWKKVNPERC